MQKGLYPLYLSLFFILICFFSLLLVLVFVFSSRASDFSSLCVVYKMFWNKSACGKCSAPSFLRLSAAFYVFYIVYSFCVLFFCMSYSTFNLSTSPRSSVAVCLPVCCILNVTNVHILSRNVDDVCARAHSLAPGIYAYFAAIHSQNRFFPSNPVSLVRFEFKKYYSFVHIFCASCAYFIRCSSFTSYFESVACICLCSSVVCSCTVYWVL